MEKISFVLTLKKDIYPACIEGGFKINGRDVPFERISSADKNLFARATASA